MSDIYRIIGAEESPYSVKVRAYFRYKEIPHEWLSRPDASDLFDKHARLPLVPLVESLSSHERMNTSAVFPPALRQAQRERD